MLCVCVCEREVCGVDTINELSIWSTSWHVKKLFCAIIPLVPLLCCVARWRLVNKLCLVVFLT